MRRFSSRRWLLLSLITGAAIALLVPSALSALGGDPPRDSDTDASSGPQPLAFGGAVAPNSRLAGLFDAGGAPIRTRGVLSIQRLADGVYCIRPTGATDIQAKTAIVTATPEYFYSELNEIEVQWASAQSGCEGNRIAIYTLADPDDNGTYTFSNQVGFSVVVP